MKIFLLVTALALLFVIGSALAMTAIGRNQLPRRSEEQQRSGVDEDTEQR